MRVEALVAEPTVKRFYNGIVGGLARAQEVQCRLVGVRQVIQCLQDKLGTVVHPDLVGRRTPLEQQPVHDIDDLLTRVLLIDMDCQTLVSVGIGHRQRTGPLAVEQGDGNKIYRPDFVGTRRQRALEAITCGLGLFSPKLRPYMR